MSHDTSATDPKHAKPHDTSGAATKDDVKGIFTAINAIADKVDVYKSSTTELISAFSDRLTSLEKDLVDGSTADTTETPTPTDHGSAFPSLHTLLTTQPSTFTTATVTTSHNKQPSKRFFESEEESEKHKKPKRKKLKKKKKHDVSSESSQSSSDNDSAIDPQMQELMQEYEITKPKYLEDPTTVPIQSPLAQTLETWFWSVYSKEEVKAELSKPLRPSNAMALIPTQINEPIFRSLSSQALTKDMPARFIQNAFMKSSQPFAIVWEALIRLESYLKASKSSLSYKFSDTVSIDFQNLRKNMDQGLRLLGIANSQMVVHRKETLAQYLNKDFKKICKSHIPFDHWMFGSNLKTLLEDTARVNKLVQQNKPPQSASQPSKQPFFRRGGGLAGSRTNQQPRGRSHQGRGRGFARGWQIQSSSPSPQSQNKPGNLQNKQQTKP